MIKGSSNSSLPLLGNSSKSATGTTAQPNTNLLKQTKPRINKNSSNTITTSNMTNLSDTNPTIATSTKNKVNENPTKLKESLKNHPLNKDYVKEVMDIVDPEQKLKKEKNEITQMFMRSLKSLPDNKARQFLDKLSELQEDIDIAGYEYTDYTGESINSADNSLHNKMYEMDDDVSVDMSVGSVRSAVSVSSLSLIHI